MHNKYHDVITVFIKLCLQWGVHLDSIVKMKEYSIKHSTY